jgi:hypothetical protein
MGCRIQSIQYLYVLSTKKLTITISSSTNTIIIQHRIKLIDKLHRASMLNFLEINKSCIFPTTKSAYKCSHPSIPELFSSSGKMRLFLLPGKGSSVVFLSS